jgi:hypothetical protein
MIDLLRTVARSLVSAAKARRNLALRHQIAVLQRQSKKPPLKNSDRLLWVGLRRIWPGWKSALYLVQPATVVKWHRAGFRAYWRRKSRPKGGRPRVDPEVRKLIRDMWNMNPTWEGHASMPSSRSSVSRWASPRSQGTSRDVGSHHRRAGGPFSIIMLRISLPSTSSRCPRQRSGFSTCCWSCHTTGVESFISTSRTRRRVCGLLARSSKRSRSTQLHGF